MKWTGEPWTPPEDPGLRQIPIDPPLTVAEPGWYDLVIDESGERAALRRAPTLAPWIPGRRPWRLTPGPSYAYVVVTDEGEPQHLVAITRVGEHGAPAGVESPAPEADPLSAMADLAAARDCWRALAGDRFEWLCESCHVAHPPRSGDKAALTAPCPDCGATMIPSSVNVRRIQELEARLAIESR